MTPVDQSYCPTLQNTYNEHRHRINGVGLSFTCQADLLCLRDQTEGLISELSNQSVILILLHRLSSYWLDQSGVIIHIFKTT